MGVFLRKLKHQFFPRKEFKIKAKYANLEWLGSPNGGFFFDTQRVQPNDIVLSFGVGTDVSFDLQLIEKTQCNVYGFDPTPKSIEWLAEQSLPGNYAFFPYGIALETGEVRFFLPKNENHVSGSLMQMDYVDTHTTVDVPVKSMHDIVKDVDAMRVKAVKMDIEGAEYEVMPSVLMALPNLAQIAVEIHERFVDGGISNTQKMIAQIEQYGFQLAAISDSLEELTFIKA
jgi:FkbM family methyltransferase